MIGAAAKREPLADFFSYNLPIVLVRHSQGSKSKHLFLRLLKAADRLELVSCVYSTLWISSSGQNNKYVFFELP